MAFAKRLGEVYGNVALVTPAVADGDPEVILPGVTQLRLGVPGSNPIERARIFREKLKRVLQRQLFHVAHFRSPLEGIPLIDPGNHRGAKLIYEVNGFPSIEMPYHYPALGAQLVRKLRSMERACLESVDQIVTVSRVNRDEIVDRVNDSQLAVADKISIIPNGVDTKAFRFKTPDLVSRTGSLQLVYAVSYTHLTLPTKA